MVLLLYYYHKRGDCNDTIAKMLQGHRTKRYVCNLQLTLYNKKPIGYT